MIEWAAECRLRRALAQHRILFAREDLGPFGVGMDDLIAIPRPSDAPADAGRNHDKRGVLGKPKQFAACHIHVCFRSVKEIQVAVLVNPKTARKSLRCLSFYPQDGARRSLPA